MAVATLVLVTAMVGCGSDLHKSGSGEVEVGGARVSWGEPAAGNPKAVVMLIHGGGWQRSDSGYAEQEANAKTFHDHGYATVAIGYDEGAKGFQQVVDVYKETRRRYPGLPICASGISAGGNLALMLATREPDLACVLAVSAPTDLASLGEQDPKGDEAYQAAVTAFGKDQLGKFSPVRYANRIEAKVLLIAAEGDPIVPAEQGRELARILPGAELVVLSPGPVHVQWAHYAGVQANAQDIAINRDFDFLRQATQQ